MKSEINVSIGNISAELEKMQERMKGFQLSNNCETIYFLGVTGSGKSTTINYFLKKGPLAQIRSRGGRFQIEALEKGPQIGHTNTSCTEIPAIYKDPNGDKVYIDPPGFMDTKGPMQEATNGLCNALMLDKGVNTKIILVIEYSTIQSGRGGIIPELARRLFDLFGRDFDRLINSILILVTKVDSDEIEIEYIVKDLRDIAFKNQNMTEPLKAMIAGVIENNHVLMLPLPKQIEQKTIPDLIRAVERTQPTTLSCRANVSLSFEAKAMLQDLSDSISQEVNSSIKQIRSDLQRRFSNVSYSSEKQYDRVINQLRIAKNSIDQQVQQNWQQGFTSFALQINLHPKITNKIISNINKMAICRKLNFPINLQTGLVETISTYLTGVINNLQNQMSKFMAQKQIKEMNDRHQSTLQSRNTQFNKLISEMDARHQTALQNRNAQFMNVVTQMRLDAQAREKATKQQIKLQKEYSEKIMRNAEKQHAEQIKAVRQQIEASRYKPSPQSTCPIF